MKPSFSALPHPLSRHHDIRLRVLENYDTPFPLTTYIPAPLAQREPSLPLSIFTLQFPFLPSITPLLSSSLFSNSDTSPRLSPPFLSCSHSSSVSHHLSFPVLFTHPRLSTFSLQFPLPTPPIPTFSLKVLFLPPSLSSFSLQVALLQPSLLSSQVSSPSPSLSTFLFLLPLLPRSVAGQVE